MGSKDFRLVYSTDSREGRCTTCGKYKHECKCVFDRPSKPAAEQNVKVGRESKGRGGKTVTLVTGLVLSTADKEALLKELKSRCACGGTVTEDALELQGDHRDRVVELLVKKGYKAKKSGG